ncbi:MAG: hypothetical protein ACKO7A_20350, partial [Microcystis sp.]
IEQNSHRDGNLVGRFSFMILSIVTGFLTNQMRFCQGLPEKEVRISGERCRKKGQLAAKLILKTHNYSPLPQPQY